MKSQDVKFRTFPLFKGKFFTFAVDLYTNYELGYKEVFLVFSKGSREATLKKLWLKLVWDNLTSEEFSLLISSLTDLDYKKWAFLKAITLLPKQMVRKRLIEAEQQTGETVSSRLSYQGIQSMGIEIQRINRKLPKPKKFKGYIKSNSAGDKGFLGTVRSELPTPVISETDITNEDQYKIWVSLLTCLSSVSEPETVLINKYNFIPASFSPEEVAERVLELNRKRRLKYLPTSRP